MMSMRIMVVIVVLVLIIYEAKKTYIGPKVVFNRFTMMNNGECFNKNRLE